MNGKDFRSVNTGGSKNKLLNEIRASIRCMAKVILRCFYSYDSDEEDNKQKKSQIKGSIFHLILSFFLGLSNLDIGAGPFGLAMICSSYGNLSVASFCGAAISCFFDGIDGLIEFFCFFLIFLIRKSLTRSAFDEKVSYRLATVIIASSFVGACNLFTDGVTAIALLSYFTYVFLSGICVYFFSAIFTTAKNEISSGLYLISLFAVCVCTLPALNRLSFGVIDLGIILASFLTLWFSKAKGPIYGCVSGFIFGFACINPLCSAPLGIGGLVAGYLFTKSFTVSAFIFPVSTLFSYIYLLGSNAFTDFLPFTVCGSLVFLALYRFLPDIFSHGIQSVSSHESKVQRKENEFEKVSDSLTGLSSIICKFAEHMKAPSSTETQKIIEKAFTEVCESCSMCSMCYAKRQCNLPAVTEKITSSIKHGNIKEESLSSMLLGKCIKITELCNYINSQYSELYFLTMRSNRTQTVAGLYNSMSHLMKNTASNENDNKTRDERLEKTISEALKRIGVVFSQVRVYGKRCKSISIHGIRPDKIPCSAKELCDYLSDECRIRLSEPTFDISDSADMIMRLSREGILSVEYAQCCEAKDDESVNGDTVSFFDTDSNYFYSIIADGMGSGKTAAATSRLACVFLEKMLSSGAAKNICIEMLNNLLLSKNDEAFSGIDLLEIDKLCGSAYFIKAGAAPSFVLRKSRLYKISSETPPVGIIPSFSAESTRFSLEKGDIIFMVSDGVIQSDSDAVWLSELIRIDADNEPAYLASELIERARSINKRCDDASACVIKIN